MALPSTPRQSRASAARFTRTLSCARTPRRFASCRGDPSTGAWCACSARSTTPDGRRLRSDTRAILANWAVEDARKRGLYVLLRPEMEFYLFRLDESGVPTKNVPMTTPGMDVAPEDKGENVRREACLTLEQMGHPPESSHHEERVPVRTRSTSAMQIPLPPRTTPSRSRAWLHDRRPPETAFAQTFPKSPCRTRPEAACTSIFLVKSCRRHGCHAAGNGRYPGACIYELTVFLNPLDSSYRRFGCRKAPALHLLVEREIARSSSAFPQPPANTAKAELRSPDPSCNPYLAFCASDLRRARWHPVQASPARACRCEPVHRARERDRPSTGRCRQISTRQSRRQASEIAAGAFPEAPA